MRSSLTVFLLFFKAVDAALVACPWTEIPMQEWDDPNRRIRHFGIGIDQGLYNPRCLANHTTDVVGQGFVLRVGIRGWTTANLTSQVLLLIT